MKKIFITLGVIILISAIGIKLSQKKQTEEFVKNEEDKPVLKKKRQEHTALMHKKSSIPAKKENFPPECSTFMHSLVDKDFEQIKIELDDIRDSLTTDCSATVSKNYGPAFQNGLQACLEKDENFKTDQCIAMLAQIRAVAMNLAYPDDHLEDLDDTILMNKLVANFLSNPNPSAETLALNVKMADILTSRNPDLYAAHKAKLINQFMQELLYKKNGLGEAINDSWDTLSQFELDDDIKDFPLIRDFVNSGGDVKKFAPAVDAYIEANPDSAKGYYFKAGLEWKMGHKDAAISYLKQAHGISPKDNDVNYTLDLVKDAKKADEIFRLSMGFNFDSL